MRFFRLSLYAAILTLLMVKGVSACTCIISTPAEDFIRADAVFIGKVVSVDDQFGAKFHVLKSWKLIDADTVVVYTTDPRKSGCAYVFQKDESYMVYAELTKGKLHTGQCWGTVPLIYAVEQLKDLQGRTEVRLIDRSSHMMNRDGIMKTALITGGAVLLFAAIGVGVKMVRRRPA
ncbi:MAG TPA: hypothetical protein VIQ24_16285 [Pyrinomonadaceae bacterium]